MAFVTLSAFRRTFLKSGSPRAAQMLGELFELAWSADVLDRFDVRAQEIGLIMAANLRPGGAPGTERVALGTVNGPTRRAPSEEHALARWRAAAAPWLGGWTAGRGPKTPSSNWTPTRRLDFPIPVPKRRRGRYDGPHDDQDRRSARRASSSRCGP